MEQHEWDERADGYDKHVRRIFPHYEVLHQLAQVPLSDLPNGSRILVVGAGTGQEAVSLAQKNPTWQITAQDISAGMIAQGKEKHPNLPIDWRSVPIEALPEDKFDAATLLLVLHFLPDNRSEEGKLGLLKQLARRLKPKAPLVYADLMPDPESYETHLDLWKSQVLANGVDERILGAFDYLTQELPATDPDRNSELLVEAGFEEPVTIYQEFWLRLFVSRRK